MASDERLMDIDREYLMLLRRELTRAQARLKRAEWERDQLRDQNERLAALLREHRIAVPAAPRRKNPTAKAVRPPAG
jgi:hypothetical protein